MSFWDEEVLPQIPFECEICGNKNTENRKRFINVIDNKTGNISCYFETKILCADCYNKPIKCEHSNKLKLKQAERFANTGFSSCIDCLTKVEPRCIEEYKNNF